MTLPSEIKIVEVGPRDGLQNESTPIPTTAKVTFIRALAAAGLQRIEVASFVNPKAVPQLADAPEVIKGLPDDDGVTYSALVPNERGLDRAIQSGVRRIAVFTAASDSFTKKNIGMTIEESLTVFRPVLRKATDAGISARGYVSTSFTCPFEGRIDPEKVAEVSQRLLDLGVDEVAISDTIGAAVPTDVESTVGQVLRVVPRDRIALHFHDTCGTALANVLAGLQLGIATFDSSAGGLGGCPFAPGAAGNLATEDLVYMLDGMKIRTGVDSAGVLAAARGVGAILGRTLPSAQARRVRHAKAPGSAD